MPVGITNNGTHFIYNYGGKSKIIVKSHVKEVTVVRGTILRIDIGEGPLHCIYIDQAIISTPASFSAEDLRNQLLEMLSTEGVSRLDTLITKAGSIDNKVLADPSIIDETIPGTTYKGFCATGESNPNAFVWAIQRVTVSEGTTTISWAEGNRTMNKQWSGRDHYSYS